MKKTASARLPRLAATSVLCLWLGAGVCAAQAQTQASAPAHAVAQAASPSVSQAAPAGARTLPADLPLRRDAEPGFGTGAGYAIWLVLLAGAAAWAWAWSLRRRGAAPGWLRRWAPAGTPAVLQLVASRPLAPHGSLHVVRWGERELLLGCTAQGVTLLDARPAGGTPAPGGDAARGQAR